MVTLDVETEAELDDARAETSDTPDDTVQRPPRQPLIPAARGLQSAWPPEGVSGPVKRRTPLGFFRELPFLIIIAFTLAVVMKTFLVQAFYIPSESMERTLHGCPTCTGDRVLVNKLAYHLRDPVRGEIIVMIARKGAEDHSMLGRVKHFVGEGIGLFKPTETDYIKRIIGLPGETIQVTDVGVFITPIHGARFQLREPYIYDRAQQGPSFGPYKVPIGRYFVMGDNRANSSDSRVAGSLISNGVKRENIVGKAFVKIFPPGRMGILHVPCYPQRSPRVRCPAVPTPASSQRSLPAGPGGLIFVAAISAVQFRSHDRRPERSRAA